MTSKLIRRYFVKNTKNSHVFYIRRLIRKTCARVGYSLENRTFYVRIGLAVLVNKCFEVLLYPVLLPEFQFENILREKPRRKNITFILYERAWYSDIPCNTITMISSTTMILTYSDGTFCSIVGTELCAYPCTAHFFLKPESCKQHSIHTIQ